MGPPVSPSKPQPKISGISCVLASSITHTPNLRGSLFYTLLNPNPKGMGLGSRDGTVVEHLPPTQASHQCGPGSIPGLGAICGLSLLLVLILAPRGFSPGTPVFPSPQKPTFPNSTSIWNPRATSLLV